MGATTSSLPVILNVKEITKILPHRYPFLLVDRIIYLNLEENRTKIIRYAEDKYSWDKIGDATYSIYRNLI